MLIYIQKKWKSKWSRARILFKFCSIAIYSGVCPDEDYSRAWVEYPYMVGAWSFTIANYLVYFQIINRLSITIPYATILEAHLRQFLRMPPIGCASLSLLQYRNKHTEICHSIFQFYWHLRVHSPGKVRLILARGTWDELWLWQRQKEERRRYQMAVCVLLIRTWIRKPFLFNFY